MKNYSILAFFLFLTACNFSFNNKPSKNTVPLDQMKKVFWDLMQVDEYYTRTALLDSQWKKNNKQVQLYQQVFDLHKVDRAAFYNTMEYMEKNPVAYKELIDSVNALSKRQKLGFLKN